ncbi:MAG: TrkA family potassium uptake protein [Selenomonadaceae bacterium]|nr:TrkA family potassium uptake protein [Selenomonadaceae bacterium]
MKKNFAVLGLGRFGRNVAVTLEEMGYNVLGVDKDENVAAEMADSLTKVVSFDIREMHALKEVGISDFDVVVIASKSLEASLMATMLCKEFNVNEIIVKAIDERHAEMAKRLGATKIIFSERDTARQLARQLVSKNSSDLTEIDTNIGILTLNVPKKFIGKNLIETNLREEYNVNVIAIRSEDKILVPPPPNHVFIVGEKIFVVGTSEALLKFEREVGSREQ